MAAAVTQRRLLVERRQVALSGGLWPNDFLILEADEQEVRIAHYRLKRPNERRLRCVDEQSWEKLLEGKYVRSSEKRQSWLRQAAKGPTALSVLLLLFEAERHDARTVNAYLHSTSWGERLP